MRATIATRTDMYRGALRALVGAILIVGGVPAAVTAVMAIDTAAWSLAVTNPWFDRVAWLPETILFGPGSIVHEILPFSDYRDMHGGGIVTYGIVSWLAWTATGFSSILVAAVVWRTRSTWRPLAAAVGLVATLAFSAQMLSAFRYNLDAEEEQRRHCQICPDCTSCR